MKTVLALALVAAMPAGLVVGCNPAATDVHRRLIEQQQRVHHLEEENTRLRQDIDRQQEQIETLMELDDRQLELLYFVDRIELGRHTGGWDLDGQNGQDGIKVFLTPHDQHGSALKAAGAATVQLYDLAAEPGENLIAEFHWTVEQLREQWVSGFMSYHYALNCPWGDNPPAHDIVTVRVTFVDYLTGKTFHAQKTCQIDLTAEPDQPAEDAESGE